MNRFVCIAKYQLPLANYMSLELLDTKTGIVYLQTIGDGPEHITPLLFDNGKPQHLNKEEIENVKMMINRIGVERYRRIINRCTWSPDEDKFADADREWTLAEVYNALCKTK